MRGRACWVPVPDGSRFPIENLPYGSFTIASTGGRRSVGVAIGDYILDLGAAARATRSSFAELVAGPVINPLMSAGPEAWKSVRDSIVSWLSDEGFRAAIEPHLHARADAGLHMPIDVGDYADFYSSEYHAVNAGRIFRPGGDPLPPQWKHLPVGYHGRAGTIVVSGTPVIRPQGQLRDPRGGGSVFLPTQALDIEAELGFIVGVPSPLGRPVPVSSFAEHVFGAVILNDWSARDIQAWEYAPLGPFLGKSFMTSISPWVVPLAALTAARTDPPRRAPATLPYLDDAECPWAFDVTLEVALNGHVISRPPFSSMYWTAAQQLAHMTSNGASLRTGDIYGSGTISGPGADEYGSLLELSWGGSKPFQLPDGSVRAYLEDGDEVVISATAPSDGGGTIGFGEVRGRVEPARASSAG
jgi:fumarylacetoacetase